MKANQYDAGKGISRRTFIQGASGAVVMGIAGMDSISLAQSEPAWKSRGKFRVGIIGCGSVSWKYIPELQSQDYIEIISACDIILPRAEEKAKNYNIPHVYSRIDQMLAGVDFDFLVNTTSMPSHYEVNKAALEAGKHVWCEKPLADSVSRAQELVELAEKKGVGFWGAPCTVISPQFEFMAKTLAGGKLGRVCAAHAFYGHNGSEWLWAPEFFQKGGGCLYDLGVYNITTLTGLFGPVKRVAGMWNIVHPEVTVTTHEGQKVQVKVETDENAMLLMDHGNGVLSHVQSGFSYFDRAKPHDSTSEERYSIEIIGDSGAMALAGYDWGPVGVDLTTKEEPETKRYSTDLKGYRWQRGASYVMQCMLSGKRPLVSAQHATHALEIMIACRQSYNTGRYVDIESSFKWPVIS